MGSRLLVWAARWNAVWPRLLIVEVLVVGLCGWGHAIWDPGSQDAEHLAPVELVFTQ